MATVPGRGAAGRRGFAELLAQQATPEVLRDNPFRVIGLPTDATSRDLRRRAEQLRRDPDVPAAEVARVEAALRRLRDPIQRLIDELLWYWPEPAADHNAAVSELERFVEGVEGGEGGDGDLVELCGLAVGAMAAELGASATAEHVAARAAALDDPRVTAADARPLVEEAQLVVPLVALRIAARAHSAGETDLATALARTVRAHTDAGVARDAAAKVLEPAVGRVRALVEAAERASRNDRARGAERATDLLEQTAADRALADALLDDGDPVRAAMVDRIVDQVYDDVISFYNETSDDDTAIRLLQEVKALRPSSVAQARIDENLEIVRDNAELRQCWFCRTAPSDEAAGYQIDLHGNVERDYFLGRVTWQRLKVTVPRCLACAAAHRRQTRTNAVGCLSAVVVFVVGAVATASGLPPALVFLVVPVLAVVVPGLMGAKPSGVRDRALRFPPLQQRLASGWSFGARPPGAQ